MTLTKNILVRELGSVQDCVHNQLPNDELKDHMNSDSECIQLRAIHIVEPSPCPITKQYHSSSYPDCWYGWLYYDDDPIRYEYSCKIEISFVSIHEKKDSLDTCFLKGSLDLVWMSFE